MSCLVLAHRGASLDAPENTLRAFELAVEQRADMIETDLHLLRDGAIALHHDAEAAGHPLDELDLAALRHTAPAIPTLDEALDAVGARIAFNLELKRDARQRDYPGLPARALEAVRRRGWLSRTLFSSFYDPALAELRALEPAARIGLLISSRSQVAIEERAQRLGAEAVNPERRLVTPELVAKLHASGLRVLVFTVDDADDLARLVDWGVDGIFTNAPARLRAIVNARESRSET